MFDDGTEIDQNSKEYHVFTVLVEDTYNVSLVFSNDTGRLISIEVKPAL